MANISKIRRERMIAFLEKLKQQNITNDEVLIAIGEIENELNSKKYGLVWEKHDENVDIELKNNIPVFTESKDREIRTTNSENCNFLLEGDNLHSLYLLEKTKRGTIGLIYIDPPYNTGKEDFMYNDKYVDELDGYKNSKWLSFMERRLSIARELLSKDGVIFISIDDNEYAPLKLLCDEIFGVDNCLSIHHIQVRYANKSLNERKAFQECLEYVLIYAKDASCFDANRPTESYSLDSFKFKIHENIKPIKMSIAGKDVEVFKKGDWTIEKVQPGIDNLKETWITGSIYSGTGHGTVYQKVVEPRLEEDGYGCLYKIYGLGEDGLGYRYFSGPQKAGATKGKMYTGVPTDKRKDIEDGVASKLKTITNFYDFSPDFGNIRQEGGVAFNSGKKPIKMLKQFINYHKSKDITVLDFFAGSGSTAHAVLSLNQDDGGNRKFILCTNNENNICENVTYKRIENVIKGYSGHQGISSNLKYYKTDFVPKSEEFLSESLMNHIKEMVQLENGIILDNSNYLLILNEEEAEQVEKNWASYNSIKGIYISNNVLLTASQNALFSGVELRTIPDYYFDIELKEVGETW